MVAVLDGVTEVRVKGSTLAANDVAELRRRFADLHGSPGFVMPNAWNRGAVRMFTQLGYLATATTSSGHARSIGKDDQEVTLDELLAHVEDLCGYATIPVNVDAERLFPANPGGISGTVDSLAEAGAAGCSIEDYDPDVDSIVGVEQAVAAVAEAAEACRRHGIVLTARAENHLYGVDDLDDTIDRLVRYRDAGADCVYAPGPSDEAAIVRIVSEVGAPVNVLWRANGPRAADLVELGVTRVSTGGMLQARAMATVETALGEL